MGEPVTYQPCRTCGQTHHPTAYQSKEMKVGQGYLCQRCLERIVGELHAFRWGQGSVGGGNCACPNVNQKGEPSPWQEIAIRAMEDQP